MKTGHQRLLKLADMLDREGTKPNKDYYFNMGIWGHKSLVPGCGTAACAIGLALINEEFIDEGFCNPSNNGYWLSPYYNGRVAYDAVMKFFELTGQEAKHLFSAEAYPNQPTEMKVADRVRELVITQNKDELDIRS